jgi:hypothetical protein
VTKSCLNCFWIASGANAVEGWCAHEKVAGWIEGMEAMRQMTPCQGRFWKADDRPAQQALANRLCDED